MPSGAAPSPAWMSVSTGCVSVRIASSSGRNASSTISTRVPESCSENATSCALQRVLAGTTTAPAHQVA
ncbi:MAG: hypothetical protein QOF76_1979 [Solirubrobacteraceae bacterium]|nr:hypothetical protein [Solirubrobacteraceae bacterium]